MPHNREQILIDFIQSRQQTKFEWGKHDCSLFVADAILALHEIDHAQEFRGKYSSFKGALKALKTHGKGDLKSTLESKFGKSKAPLLALNGDIALVRNNQDELMLGIVFVGVWVACENHIRRVDLDDIEYCWEVR